MLEKEFRWELIRETGETIFYYPENCIIHKNCQHSLIFLTVTLDYCFNAHQEKCKTCKLLTDDINSNHRIPWVLRDVKNEIFYQMRYSNVRCNCNTIEYSEKQYSQKTYVLNKIDMPSNLRGIKLSYCVGIFKAP